jgi:aryl-alcohol dehydrogenase-like predicted oxidoreductase
VVQLPLSLISAHLSADVIHCCRELGIEIMGYGPLAQGLLTGKYGVNCGFQSNDRRHRLPHFRPHFILQSQPGLRYLRQLAARYGKTTAQVALRWALDHPGVATVVVGARTSRQLEENLGAIGWKLASAEWDSLSAFWNTASSCSSG